MITINCGFLNRNKIVLYESMHEITAQRWKEFNKYSFLESGIGSTMQDWHKNISKLWQFIEADKFDEAKQEIKNINRNVYHALTKVDFHSYLFALMVYSVNGKIQYDISQSGLEKTIKLVDQTGVKQSDVVNTVTELKKKLLPN